MAKISRPESLFIKATQILTMKSNNSSISQSDDSLVGLVNDGGIVVRNGVIEWIGEWTGLSEKYGIVEPHITTGVVSPGLIDCHTHTLFGGERIKDFNRRNRGSTYLEILEAGGGIHDTVNKTRRASDEELRKNLLKRLRCAQNHGISLIEVKTGYGLSVEQEFRHLKILKDVKKELKDQMEMVITFLGAHVIPKEFKTCRGTYIDLLCNDMIPKIGTEQLADCCDVYCDTGAYSVDEAETILSVARDNGLQTKIHAEQLAYTGGSLVAAKLGSLSADHLDHITPEGIAALAASDTVAVALPGVNYFLNHSEVTPVREMLEAGVEVALATDFNPGSCMTQNLLLVMNTACIRLGMSSGEVFRAVTVAAAKALGKEKEHGTLTIGKRADLCCFETDDYRMIPYHFGHPHLERLLVKGALVYSV